jgi:DNA sulfur modification protein DndE
MIFTKIKLSEESTKKLELLKKRTGLTPNILCRLALCVSLDKEGIPNANTNSNGQEINRFTLNGEFDVFFISLVKQRCIEDKLDPETDFFKQYKLHTERGVDLIYNRLKYIGDLAVLKS